MCQYIFTERNHWTDMAPERLYSFLSILEKGISTHKKNKYSNERKAILDHGQKAKLHFFRTFTVDILLFSTPAGVSNLVDLIQ